MCEQDSLVADNRIASVSDIRLNYYRGRMSRKEKDCRMTDKKYFSQNSQIYSYVATCLFGLERFVGEEIDALGYERTFTIDGRVGFRGDISAVARCNLWLRTAERLFINAGSFHAETFDELFEGTKAIEWEQWIGRDDAFPVKGHSVKSALYSIPDCQKIVKKAIVDRLSPRFGISHFEETGTKYQIEFFILKDEAYLMIDASGTALHKRGYRALSGEAPLRETLAAAVVKISRPREEVLLWDPFCGSGTIAIEAALLMTNTAPGLNRSFAAEQFNQISHDIWSAARDEAEELRDRKSGFEVFASDIDREILELTRHNAEKAGVSDRIKIFELDARMVETGGRRGTIVCNPPYGERLGTAEDAHRLYHDIGIKWRILDRWQKYILTSDEEFEHYYGCRADKVRKLYNGMLKCGLYQYFKNGRTAQNNKVASV